MKLQKYSADKKSIACPYCGNPLRLVDTSSDNFICTHKTGYELQIIDCPYRDKYMHIPQDDVIKFYFGEGFYEKNLGRQRNT